MAGIGFELKKLFVGHSVIRKVRAYAFASIVCSGTMMMAIVMLLGVQAIAKAAGAGEYERKTLVVMVVYATLFSLLFSSVLQMFLSRFAADMLYAGKPERVMPSLLGGSVALMLPGGVFYALLLAFAPSLPVFDRALNWLFFMELIPMWLQMAYITAAKDYRRILRVFALGVALSLVLGTLLISLGMSARAALLLSLVLGYGFMLAGFTNVLLRYFPTGVGSSFYFIGHFAVAPDLVGTGFLGMTGAFLHIIIMWFSPLGESVVGPFRQAATHDAAAFYAYLVSVPTIVGFVVSVEVNFYQKYRRYFAAITDGGTLSEINVARKDMTITLGQELMKLTQVQLFFTLGYIIVMRYFLKRIGFTTDMTTMFQVMSVGYAAQSLGGSVMLLNLYFNHRRGALAIACLFFGANLCLSLIFAAGPSIYYGLGMAISGILMFAVSAPVLMAYVKKIDFHVFCGQPVMASRDEKCWTRWAERLDARALRNQRNTEGEEKQA